MTTPPITSTTDEIIADLERLTSDSEVTDEQWISGFTAGDFRALLAERADLKQQLVAACITADNCEMFRKDAERYQWLRPRMVGVSFDWDDEGMTALAFEMPGDVSFGGNCDKNIDAAMRQ